MSAALLYVAIVVMWAAVLVPMWLRRDSASERWAKHAFLGAPTAGAEDTEEPAEVPAQEAAEGGEARPRERPRRAEPHATPRPRPQPRRQRTTAHPRSAAFRRQAVLTRRRSRLGWCSLAVALSVGVAAGGMMPWWGALPSLTLLAGYLAALRAAVQLDVQRRAAHQRRRAAQIGAHRREAQAASSAKIIDFLSKRDELYDQYADARRDAIGY